MSIAGHSNARSRCHLGHRNGNTLNDLLRLFLRIRIGHPLFAVAFLQARSQGFFLFTSCFRTFPIALMKRFAATQRILLHSLITAFGKFPYRGPQLGHSHSPHGVVREIFFHIIQVCVELRFLLGGMRITGRVECSQAVEHLLLGPSPASAEEGPGRCHLQ